MAKSQKKGKKVWIKIMAPAEFNGIELGESYVYEPESLIGKKLDVNLSILIGDIKKQNTSVGFKIKEVKDRRVFAKIVSVEVQPTHVKRMVRTLKERIDDSFEVTSNDKAHIRIKPLLLTRAKVSNSVLTMMRKKIREKIKKLAAEHTASEMVMEIISGQLQRGLRTELSKIYPLTSCEIRKLELDDR